MKLHVKTWNGLHYKLIFITHGGTLLKDTTKMCQPRVIVFAQPLLENAFTRCAGAGFTFESIFYNMSP